MKVTQPTVQYTVYSRSEFLSTGTVLEKFSYSTVYEIPVQYVLQVHHPLPFPYWISLSFFTLLFCCHLISHVPHSSLHSLELWHPLFNFLGFSCSGCAGSWSVHCTTGATLPRSWTFIGGVRTEPFFVFKMDIWALATKRRKVMTNGDSVQLQRCNPSLALSQRIHSKILAIPK